MAFRTPTLDEQHAILVAVHKRLQPDIDVSEAATDNLWCQTQAAGVTDNHAHIATAKADLNPKTATGDKLREWAELRGVVPKGATPARKSAALRVVGVATTPVPGGTTWRHLSGQRFKIPIDAGELVGPGGFVDCDLVAIDTGSSTQLDAGEVLTIEEPIADLEDEAELQKKLDEDGTDREEDGDLSARVVSRFRDPPRGGTRVDYSEWALELTGNKAAFTYPIRGGFGTVHVVALHAGSGTARILDAVEVAALQAFIDAKRRPVSVKGFRVLQVVAQPVDVELTFFPNGEPEFEVDWDDTTPPTFSAWDSVTRTLTLGADRPASMSAGHRITFENGTTGAERVIESLGVAADEVVLEADEDGDEPVAGEIYSGGSLVAGIRTAIQVLIDALGPANPDAHRYGPWEGNLRPQKIGSAAEAVDGVLSAAVVTPAATVEAGDTSRADDDWPNVGLITAGRILVRRAH